jgi:hypothetical protein
MKNPILVTLIIALIFTVLAFIACDNGGDKECECPNGKVHYEDEACCTNNGGAKTKDCNCTSIARPGSVTFHDKIISVDYSGSGLTQAQADTVTPKLQKVFTNLMAIVADTPEGIKLATMVNRPGFKIVIIPGDSGCGRDGDTMTLGADFVLANDHQGIGENIAPVIVHDDLFADIPPHQTTITAFGLCNAPVPDTQIV